MLGVTHPGILKYEILWEGKDDPDNIPDDLELTEEEAQLMESKIGGTPYYSDDELEPGHTYLLQLGEKPAGINFAERHAIVTRVPDGTLYVRLQ
jgi:uncharacterized protein YwqG